VPADADIVRRARGFRARRPGDLEGLDDPSLGDGNCGSGGSHSDANITTSRGVAPLTGLRQPAIDCRMTGRAYVPYGVLLLSLAALPSSPRCAPLGSTVFRADSGSVRWQTGAIFRALVDTTTTNLSRLEMHVTTLAPGQSPHAPHRHAHEELMVVRSGALEVLQNGITRHARAGDVIFEASNELHGLRNPGPDSATYLVIRIDPHDVAGQDTSRCVAR